MSGLILSSIDRNKLYPPFYSAVTQMLEEGLRNGTCFWGISGYRSYSEQDALWHQGRTRPGAIVTAARGGQSAHNFGVAMDCGLDRDLVTPGAQMDWDPEKYKPLGTLSLKYGLLWGGTWAKPDWGHVQMRHFVTSSQMAPLRDAYEDGGLLSVFKFLDAESSL